MAENRVEMFKDRIRKYGDIDLEAKAFLSNYKTRIPGITLQESTYVYNQWFSYEEVSEYNHLLIDLI